MTFQKRLWLIAGALALCFGALMLRLLDLSLINRTFLQKQFTERTIREVVIPSFRGIITDRNGEPLAISTPVYAVWADPKNLDIDNSQLLQLSKLIDISPKNINELINKKNKRQFVYLKRDLPPEQALLVQSLKIPGISTEKQYRRFYPDGESCAQVVGITNIDDKGQEGLELQYNQWLEGQSGLKKVLKDRYGNEVADMGILRKPEAGHNLTLSIDSRLQYIAYNELLNGVNTFGATYGSIIILDIKTGEILAMTNAPSFNPNLRPTKMDSNFRNRAVTDLFEPGSTFKALAMTTAISTGKYHAHSTVNTSPGYWYVDGNKIDDDGYNNGIIDMTRILEVSSNVGMSKVMLTLPFHLYLDLLHRLGFTQATGINFPGESDGMLNKRAANSPFVYATLSFGYGVSVNLLQLAHAYATLANNGASVPLSLLKIDHPPEQTQIIAPAVSQEIRDMLESVLKKGGGTGVAAQVPGYRVTGKTGTTRILGPHGYEKDHHNSIFVGIAPATHPQYLVAVFLHDPSKKNYFGGYVAGPVFSKVMASTLRIMNVPPDNTQ